MDKSEFLKQQYITLRREIEETKSRIFKLVGSGIIVVPAANFLGQSFKLDLLILTIPVLVIVLLLFYLSENHAIMRAGRYIRLHIEPEVKGIVGWENWLQIPDDLDTRSVDKFANYCFYLLFFVYYTCSVFLSTRFAYKEYGTIQASLILGGYVAIGIWFLIFVIKNIRLSTTTKTGNK